MAENITVTGQEAYFNEDAKFFKDVYIYGTLYYDFDLDKDNLVLDNVVINNNLTVNGTSNLNNLSVTGISTFSNFVSFGSTISVASTATFQTDVNILGTLDVQNLVVGIATVQERFELTDNTGTNYLVGFAAGPSAGRVGIGSTLPEQKLDIGGAVKINTVIYDSVNSAGFNGYFLSRDSGGIRWVAQNPANLQSIFIQNESILVGGGQSFTTLNFVGTRSGGDLVNATVGATPDVIDIDIIDHWTKNASGIHTTVNVGINVANPSFGLDVGADAYFRNPVEFESAVFVDAGLIVSGFTTGTISTSLFSVISGFASNANRAGFTTFSDFSGISTFSVISGFATNTKRAGFATFSDFAGISTFSVIAGFSSQADYAGFSTFAIISGFSTVSDRAGFATFSDFAGISTFSVISGFATVSDFTGIATFATTAGVSTHIRTTATTTNKDFFLPFVENSVTTGIETVRVDSGIKYNPSSNALRIDGNLSVGTTSLFQGNIELDAGLIDINGSTGAGKTDYRLASVGTGVSWRPPGVQTQNIIYVTKDGNDSNSGLLEGDAKATIGAAAAIAQDGDTIYVRPGVYFENNPIGLRTDVSVSGQDLRLVTVVPNNVTKDVFHVRRGCLIENLNFAGSTVGIYHTQCGAVAFPPLEVANQAASGYIGTGPANEGPSGRWRSPYIRNCTNFMTGSIGMKINGNHANASYTGINSLGQDLKCMVCDSFTQYNENGIGVSITNNGYAQLVSIFTINCDIGIYCDTGGSCDITNSNSSFGNYGLYANGVGAVEDTYTFIDVKDTLNNVRKPFDGQALFFKINLADYNDVGGATGIVTAPLRTVRSIKVTNGGSGYSETAPPNVTISAPGGPEGILAELSANVSAAGTVSSIDVISSGRNFLPDQPITVTISGTGGATAEAIMDPIYYTVSTATEPTTVGLTTVTFNEFIPYSVGAGTSVEFRRISRIITSNISFEYIGAGVDINRSNPFQGGVPIPENEVVAINGGQIPFTSTDQKGNFRIGQGLTIDQTTATISGRDFNRAIQANLTPLILALGG
jgi:hypothetical protein